MSAGDIGPDFGSKIRLARAVEACLLEPEIPSSPGLARRVRARLMLARLRRARKRALVTACVEGGVLVAGCLVGAALLAPRGGAWTAALLHVPAVEGALRAFAIALTAPLETLLRLGGLGAAAVGVVLAGVAAMLLRDLFRDPLEGLASRRMPR